MTQAVTSAAPVSVDPRTRTQIVIGVLLGLFLAALDQTVVGTALPRIVTDLHGNDIYTWAFTSYLLTATISGPIYGKLSDLFGRRPILLFAVAVFLIGSLPAGPSERDGTAHRLRRRGRAHRGPRPDPHRPDQQAEWRLGRSGRRRTHRRRAPHLGGLCVARAPHRRSDRADPALHDQLVHDLGHRDVHGLDGVLHADRVPAAVVPGRRRRDGDAVRLPDPRAARRTHP